MEKKDASNRATLDGVARPWRGESIHAQLAKLERAESGYFERPRRLVRAEGPAFVREQLRLAPLRGALLALVEQPSAARLAELYRLAGAGWKPASVDRRWSEAELDALLERPGVIRIGRLLAREAPRLFGVRLGLVLLSRSSAAEDRALLLELGADDRLTSSVAEVLAGQSEEAVLALAKSVHGEARRRAMEWLIDGEAASVRAWLLREGALEVGHSEHLAYQCACTGRLHEALASAQVDDALLFGAARLLLLLATSLSAPDLSDYPEAASAVAALVAHLRGRTLHPDLRLTLEALAVCPDVAHDLARQCEQLAQASMPAPGTSGPIS